MCGLNQGLRLRRRDGKVGVVVTESSKRVVESGPKNVIRRRRRVCKK